MVAKRFDRIVLVFLICISFAQIDAVPTSYSRSDPFPVYTSLDPYNFLYKRERFIDKDGIERQRYVPQRFFISLSPFGQNADSSRNNFKDLIPLDDITGRWNMLALLYGQTPACCVLPPVLREAQQALYPTLTPPICDQSVDPCEQFGFFSVDSKYRKRGLRWDLNLHITNDVGFNFQGGVSDITNTVSCVVNLTDYSCYSEENPFDPCNTALTVENVNKYLMNKLSIIADQTGVNINSYKSTQLEDFRFNLFWRHLYEGNMIRNDWPNLYVMPFMMFSGIVALEKDLNPSKLLAVAHGNNNHHAVAASGGVHLDFVETIDLGFEVGGTYYFPRDFNCFRMPNHIYQQTLFPFVTDVRRAPGWNWHFGAKLGAYHFLEHLSFFFQYVIISHQRDTICLKVCDPAFQPRTLEKVSSWTSQIANISFDYDISPHMSIGFLWQAPLMQLFSFRSTTVLFSLSLCY